MSSRFSAIAIISTYNEADIIEQVVTDFFAQGVRVFVIDDGLTDGTHEIVQRHLHESDIGTERREKPAADSVLEGERGQERHTRPRNLHGIRRRRRHEIDHRLDCGSWRVTTPMRGVLNLLRRVR